jgi:hypothetical protein
MAYGAAECRSDCSTTAGRQTRTVAIGPSNQDLYYMLQWESLDERAQKFAAFQADPEWQEKRAATEANGPIVASISNTILQPTGFSSVK